MKFLTSQQAKQEDKMFNELRIITLLPYLSLTFQNQEVSEASAKDQKKGIAGGSLNLRRSKII